MDQKEIGLGIYNRALYYPHMHPNEMLMKRALLTWQEVGVFHEDPEYRCRCLLGDRDLAEAWELICRPIEYGDEEEKMVRQRLEDLSKEGLPNGMLDKQYINLYSQLSEETAKLLLEMGAGWLDKDGRIYGSWDTIYIVFALRAEIIAGVTTQLATDHKHALSAYTSILEFSSHNAFPVRIEEEERLLTTALETASLLTTELETVSLENVKLADLVAFRKQEIKEPGLRRLREAFAKHLKEFVSNASADGVSKPWEWKIVEDQYRSLVQDDLESLRKAFNWNTSEFASSKCIVTPLVIGAEFITWILTGNWAAAAAFGITGADAVKQILEVVSSGRTALRKRGEILKEHPLGYIYELFERT